MAANLKPIRDVALRGGFVTGIAQGVKIGTQLLSIVILARLLLPGDFGLIAAVSPAVAFIALLQNMGLQQAVIQRKETTQRQLNQVFWVSALVGAGSAVIMSLAAPALAAFYNDSRITRIMLAAGVPLFLGSMAALPLSILNRDLRFGQLAINDVAGAVAAFAVSVGAALAGAGYWSLLLGVIASAAVSLTMAWRAVAWKLRKPDFGLDSEILSFGLNLSGFNIVNFFARNLDNVLIGKYFGTITLGYYDRAYKLLLFPLQNINAPVTRIMIPLLSRIQDDKSRMREVYLRSTGFLALVTVPGVAALTATSSETVHLLFGPKWLNVAPIFAFLGIAGLVQPIANTTGWLYISQGRTREMLRLGACSSIATVGSFFVGISWGAAGVAASYAITTLMLLPFRWWYIARATPISFRDSAGLQLPYLLSAAVTFAVTRWLVDLVPGSDLRNIVTALALSYCLSLVTNAVTARGRATIREGISIVFRIFGYLQEAAMRRSN